MTVLPSSICVFSSGWYVCYAFVPSESLILTLNQTSWHRQTWKSTRSGSFRVTDVWLFSFCLQASGTKDLINPGVPHPCLVKSSFIISNISKNVINKGKFCAHWQEGGSWSTLLHNSKRVMILKLSCFLPVLPIVEHVQDRFLLSRVSLPGLNK